MSVTSSNIPAFNTGETVWHAMHSPNSRSTLGSWNVQRVPHAGHVNLKCTVPSRPVSAKWSSVRCAKAKISFRDMSGTGHLSEAELMILSYHPGQSVPPGQRHIHPPRQIFSRPQH